MLINLHKQAEETIRNHGDRVTSGRVQILAVLLGRDMRSAIMRLKSVSRVNTDWIVSRSIGYLNG